MKIIVTLFLCLIFCHYFLMWSYIILFLCLITFIFGKALSYLLTNLSRFLNGKNQRVNHIFGSRYYPSVIENENYLRNVIRYLYQNPVRSSIVSNVCEYPYSSIFHYLGEKNDGMIIKPDLFTENCFQKGLAGRDLWVTEISGEYHDYENLIMSRSLKNTTFKFAVNDIKTLMKENSNLKVY